MSSTMTRRDCDQMLAYLPHFTLPLSDELMNGLTAVDQDGYPELVARFQHLADTAPWVADAYPDMDKRDRLDDPQWLADIDLAEIRRILTYIVRGDRWTRGFSAGMIEDGTVAAVLRRLAELRESLPE